MKQCSVGPLEAVAAARCGRRPFQPVPAPGLAEECGGNSVAPSLGRHPEDDLQRVRVPQAQLTRYINDYPWAAPNFFFEWDEFDGRVREAVSCRLMCSVVPGLQEGATRNKAESCQPAMTILL